MCVLIPGGRRRENFPLAVVLRRTDNTRSFHFLDQPGVQCVVVGLLSGALRDQIMGEPGPVLCVEQLRQLGYVDP